MISKSEIIELTKAWLAISLAFGIYLYRYENNTLLFSIFVAGITVSLGFLAHELAHRWFAHKYKKLAEFKANNKMLLLAIIMSFFGFIIAAPGAVLISGFVNRNERGIIALAGPAANIVVAILFIPLIFIIPQIAFYGLMINAWLALFNMIPIPGFDGEKIISWNKIAYFLTAGIALIINIISILIQNTSGIVN
jgi:Zn-dependent protease